jgi:hypothetical protein
VIFFINNREGYYADIENRIWRFHKPDANGHYWTQVDGVEATINDQEKTVHIKITNQEVAETSGLTDGDTYNFNQYYIKLDDTWNTYTITLDGQRCYKFTNENDHLGYLLWWNDRNDGQPDVRDASDTPDRVKVLISTTAKLVERTLNHKSPYDGAFVQMGSDYYYIDSQKGTVLQFHKPDEKGKFWTIVSNVKGVIDEYHDTVQFNVTSENNDTNTSPFSINPSEAPKVYAYYVHFDNGPWDWTLIKPDGTLAYKLYGYDEESGQFDWQANNPLWAPQPTTQN